MDFYLHGGIYICIMGLVFMLWHLCGGIRICVVAFVFVSWHLYLCHGICVCVVAFVFVLSLLGHRMMMMDLYNALSM